MTEMPQTSPLVTTDWLAAHLGAPDIAVLDATLYLPNEGKDARAEFAVAHVPGARFFDINEIADPDTDLPHMVPTAGRFARLVGALGIGNGGDIFAEVVEAGVHADAVASAGGGDGFVERFTRDETTRHAASGWVGGDPVSEAGAR